VKLGLRHIALLILAAGCSSSNYNPVVACDAGTDSAPTKELVCAKDFCGKIVDKNTGATADCGSCQGYSQCGDNGKANVCGSSCMPIENQDQKTYGKYDVRACDYYFGGSVWGSQYGTEMEFPPSCSYMDPNNCLPIYNAWPANGVCSGAVCGAFYCCVSNLDGGVNPLLPGAMADNDGGLP
jgi:hypothetical protein